MRSIARITGSALAGAVLVAAGALLPGENDDPQPRFRAARDVERLSRANVAPAELDSTLAALERDVAEDATAADHAALAFGYLQKARVEAAPRFYGDAERAIEESFRMQPRKNFEATLAQAILNGSRHDFHGQVAWARRAVRMNPFDSQAHGILGDALLELGRTNEALNEYQRSIDLRPDLASFGRVSYAASVRGDSAGAIAAMKRALGFAASKEDAAWARWQLGELYIGSGRLAAAARQLRQALRLAADFGPAIESTAHLSAARGDIPHAIAILDELTNDFPLPGNFNFLGELLLIEGETDRASAAFAEVDRRLREYAANGVRTDVDFVTFWADRGIHLQRALDDARALYSQRRSAAVSDSLAWALYANGKYERAGHFAREALRRSPGDPGYGYHLAMIELALGHDAAARTLLRQSLVTDPSWSIIESHKARRVLNRRAPRPAN